VAGKPRDPIVRFWTKVNMNGPVIHRGLGNCWDWLAGTFSNGYGQFYDGNNKIGAHRFSYIITNGEISKNLVICHKCDRRSCVNPNHLFLGTQKENLKDMSQKGRRNPADTSGENNGRSIVTLQTVNEIRSKYEDGGISARKLGLLYGLSETQTFRIIKRESWK
jgi:hypothetical protein